MNHFKNIKGFTLIELLVVISIIGVLASVVFATTNTARSKARDARRIADFGQIRLALEFYYDKYGAYPGPAAGTVCNGAENEHGDGWCRDMRNNNGVTPIVNWIPGLQEFLTSMPHNPKPYSPRGPWPYHYCLGGGTCVGSGTNQQYWLFTSLENDTPQTCGGGAVYLWWGGVNTCAWWGAGLYVIKQF